MKNTLVIKFVALFYLMISLDASSASAATSNHAAINDKAVFHFDLMMIGGGLKTCSSLSPHHCLASTTFSDDAKTSITYRCDEKSLNRAMASSVLSVLPAEKKRILFKACEQLNRQVVTMASLTSALDAIDKGWLNQLSDKQYFSLLDMLEHRQLTLDGQTVQEEVKLSQTANPKGPQIIKQFVEQAEKIMDKKTQDKPLIGIVTASARDPFEAVSFYQQVFEQAGASAVWLPLDAAFQKALFENNCQALSHYRQLEQGNVDRERVYPALAQWQLSLCANPDKLYQLLQKLDGLFLNGGDQTLTLKAWLTPDEKVSNALKIVKDKLSAKKLVIGGTSAGTAVMSQTNMITGGSSEGALQFGVHALNPSSERCEDMASLKAEHCQGAIDARAVTYRPDGGLGFFPYGVMDTHFTERDRQVRLIQLLANTSAKMGFGVDENTALLVDLATHQLKVIGENGVWIVEQVKVSSAQKGQGQTQVDAVTHYLRSGSRALINTSVSQLEDIQLNEIKFPDAPMKHGKSSEKASAFTHAISDACKTHRSEMIFKDLATLVFVPSAKVSCQIIEQGGHGYQQIKVRFTQL